jgi:DNA-directed RNA polymerase specialized sigma54-like protein
MVVVTIILGILVITLGYASYNLLRKNEKYEDIIQEQVIYLNSVSTSIKEAQDIIETVDERGTFRSDDEVGVFFETLKDITATIGSYRLPSNYGKKEE